MKFKIKFNQTPLYIAVKNLKTEIVQLLLENDKIDISIPSIFNIKLFYIIL